MNNGQRVTGDGYHLASKQENMLPLIPHLGWMTTVITEVYITGLSGIYHFVLYIDTST